MDGNGFNGRTDGSRAFDGLREGSQRVSALSGKLGRLQGVNSKALYSNIGS